MVSTIGTSLSFLSGSEVWFVPPGDHVRKASISEVRGGPKGPLVSFGEINSIDDAADLVGCEVLMLRSGLPTEVLGALEALPEVTGYRVVDSSRGEIGRVDDTIHTGANDVWEVNGRFGQVLIPVIDDVVESVDDATRTVYVTLLEGLIDERDRP